MGGHPRGSFRQQVGEALGSIRDAMTSKGFGMADVAKLTVCIVDHDNGTHRDPVAGAAAAFSPNPAPTCTIVPGSKPGTSADRLVEIKAVGVLPAKEAP